jgi:hypothetical protein
MKFEDVKWALGELVSAALRRQHVDCECHPRLNYRGPRREASRSDQAAGAEPEERANATNPIDK